MSDFIKSGPYQGWWWRGYFERYWYLNEDTTRLDTNISHGRYKTYRAAVIFMPGRGVWSLHVACYNSGAYYAVLTPEDVSANEALVLVDHAQKLVEGHVKLLRKNMGLNDDEET